MSVVRKRDLGLAAIKFLQNAPIVEAIIDVRVEARPEFQGQDFLAVMDGLRADYPKAEARRGITLQAAFGGPQAQPEVQDHGVNGLFLRSDDEKLVAQFRTDGFTFNRLAPYTSWDQIAPRAMDLFKIYLDIALPKSVLRVATRYINRLSFPSYRFDEYLTSPPRGIPGTSSPLGSFMEVTTSAEADGSTVQYTQVLDPANSRPDASSVIIDIDAFRVGELEANVDTVRGYLSSLHELKNRVFFGALTESAVRLFE